MFALGYVIGWWVVIAVLAFGVGFISRVLWGLIKFYRARPTVRARRQARAAFYPERDLMQMRRTQAVIRTLPQAEPPPEPVALPSVAPEFLSYTERLREVDEGLTEQISDKTMASAFPHKVYICEVCRREYTDTFYDGGIGTLHVCSVGCRSATGS